MSDNVRIDKWLWAARFFKTRSLAIDAVDSGKVRIDGEKVKPARNVKLGEELIIDNGSDRWEVVVRGLSDVRSAATIARQLYLETPASIALRAVTAERHRLFREPGADIKGRPTKRDRRELGRVSSGHDDE